MTDDPTKTNVKQKPEKVRVEASAVDDSTTIGGDETGDDTLVLPSGGIVSLREMTGNEEDILLNKKNLRTKTAMDLVMQACIKTLNGKSNTSEDDVLDLWAGDRLVILYKIRELSYGAKFDLPVTCGSCQETTRVRGSLKEDVEIKGYPDGPKVSFTFVLPKSKDVVVFRHLDGHGERRLAKMNETSMTDNLAVQIISINKESPSRAKMLAWSTQDRTALRNEMNRVAGGIDLKEELYCGRCGAVIPVRLEMLMGFLFPGLIRERTHSSSDTADFIGQKNR